jgi:beta-xylosidase
MLLAHAAEIVNPILWNDLADPDVIRVGDAYYYSASNMHYVAGAPLLRSYDLANWEFIGYSVPRYDFGSKYDLEDGQRAYIQGTWASVLGFRESDQLFYCGGCIRGSDATYIYRASDPEGPWEQHSTIPHC